MDSRKILSSIIIHNSSMALSILTGSFAQVAFVTMDTLSIAGGVIKMSKEISKVFKKDYSTNELSDFLSRTDFYKYSFAKATLGWIPLVGNVTNALIGYHSFNELGWGIFCALSDSKELSKITKDEWKKYVSKGKQAREDINDYREKLPEEIKEKLNQLVNELSQEESNETKIDNTFLQTSELTRHY